MMSYSTKQTQLWGQKLAQQILARGPLSTAFVLGLQGDLGSGKTTFVQGLAAGFDIRERITSPTFVLMKKFKIPQRRAGFLRGRQNSKFKVFYHLDCYRLEKPAEIVSLGWEEIINNPANIVVIEWPEKIKVILSSGVIWLKFNIKGKNKRKITWPPFVFGRDKR